jgi:hypothetical protein
MAPKFDPTEVRLTPSQVEQFFLAEVERRAGVTRDEMLQVLEQYPYSMFTLWLRRILGDDASGERP